MLCRAYEEYQVETVYESVADLQFTHMASALISDTRGECAKFWKRRTTRKLETQLVYNYAWVIMHA